MFKSFGDIKIQMWCAYRVNKEDIPISTAIPFHEFVVLRFILDVGPLLIQIHTFLDAGGLICTTPFNSPGFIAFRLLNPFKVKFSNKRSGA